MSIVPATRKVPAGIAGILLGSFGLHKFLMGFPRAGMTMLAISVAARFLAWLHFPLAGTVAWGMVVLGFVEGIIYLVKNDGDFYRDYVIKRQEWL